VGVEVEGVSHLMTVLGSNIFFRSSSYSTAHFVLLSSEMLLSPVEKMNPAVRLEDLIPETRIELLLPFSF
jgi:hypothetical protein